MKNNVFVSVVVYVNNSVDEIVLFYKTIVPKLKQMFSEFEIILVDDASQCDYKSALQECFSPKDHFSVSLLNMGMYQGMELAMNAGRDLAIGDYVIEFDTLQIDYSLELLEEVFENVKQGYDIVAAAPKKTSFSLSRLFYLFFPFSQNKEYQMRTETFRILTRRAINQITSMNVFLPYRKAVYANSGYRMKTCVYENASCKKPSRKDLKYRRNLAIESLLLFTQTGYHLSIGMTLLMMAITLAIGIYTCVVYIVGNPIEGWTTTMLFLSFAFFGLFAILSVIVKYLSMILNMVFRKKNYIISKIEKLTADFGGINENERKNTENP